MGEVLPFSRQRTVDEAWERWCALVDERAERNLWKDMSHNIKLAQAFDEWSRLYLAGEAAK